MKARKKNLIFILAITALLLTQIAAAPGGAAAKEAALPQKSISSLQETVPQTPSAVISAQPADAIDTVCLIVGEDVICPVNAPGGSPDGKGPAHGPDQGPNSPDGGGR